MINENLEKVFYRENPLNKNFLILVFKTNNGFYILNNCELHKLDNSFNLSGYSEYNKIEKKPVKGLKVDDELNIYIKFEDNLYLTLFRHVDFNTGESYHLIDIYREKEISSGFIETYEFESDDVI